MRKRRYSEEELGFMSEVDAAMYNRGRGGAYVLSLTICLFLASFLVWAHFAVLDEVTRETALDELVAATSDARERADVFNTGMLEVITQQAPPSNRGPRPAIASGVLFSYFYEKVKPQRVL